jgi:hypothetical protein
MLLASAAARATPGPACDAGVCADGDGDGFPACPCAASAACDCDDGDPTTFPGAPETCDAPSDRNCNGIPAAVCPAAHRCLASVCVPECRPLDDFGCDPRSACEVRGGFRLCVPRDCSVFGCPPGTTCDDAEQCVPLCHPGVRCPFGQRCRGVGCVDPCEGVACAAGAACVDGICAPACDCPGPPCAGGTICDPARGTCIEAGCLGVACPAGTHCEGGLCADDCKDVVCPPQRVCRVAGDPARGRCVDLCSPSPCAATDACDWRTGVCTPPPPADGGLVDPQADLTLGTVTGGGCNTGGRTSFLFAVAIAAGILALARRRLR